MANKMECADKKGDSATVFKVVKIMSGLLTTAKQATPSTDSKGDLILDHDKLAKVWHQINLPQPQPNKVGMDTRISALNSCKMFSLNKLSCAP